MLFKINAALSNEQITYVLEGPSYVIVAGTVQYANIPHTITTMRNDFCNLLTVWLCFMYNILGQYMTENSNKRKRRNLVNTTQPGKPLL
jgi:hypothetical protein